MSSGATAVFVVIGALAVAALLSLVVWRLFGRDPSALMSVLLRPVTASAERLAAWLNRRRP